MNQNTQFETYEHGPKLEVDRRVGMFRKNTNNNCYQYAEMILYSKHTPKCVAYVY
jgi:hypothetical protein